MKKVLCLLSLVMLTISLQSIAQKKVTLQSGSTTTLYSSIDSAVFNAVSGDQIYIPGGSFVIATLVIDKGVQIYGAGHYPDSTQATGQTVITGDLRIVSGADNGSIQGCRILGNVLFGSSLSNQTVHNYGISRCNMSNLYLSFDGNPSNVTVSTNIYISENVINGNIFGASCLGTLYKKNIIGARLNNHSQSVFENNIFMLSSTGCSDYFLNSVNGCVFDNNIISYGGGYCGIFFWNASNGNVFNNNLFREAPSTYFPNGSNLQYNNYFGFVATDVFAGGTAYSFSYNEDYHMLPTCIAHNGGTDGTDPGIYGTSEPYKEGAVPANPHIQTKSISSTTNAQGDLNVNIKVAAQQN